MTQQTINIGTGPGVGDGDPLRVAFSKINQNFTEIYSGNLVVANSSPTVTSVNYKMGDVIITSNDLPDVASRGYTANLVTNAINSLKADILETPPSTLNTIQKLSAAIGDNPTFSAQTPKITTVPASALGQEGDAPNMIAFDSSYFYFCILSYDGSNDIWKRVAVSSSAWI